MKKRILTTATTILLFAGFLFTLTGASAQTIRYVKPDGTGNGSSWANASGNIQAMIDASSSGNQVWIASGTYLLTATLEMKEEVNIYGSFKGDETNINARPKSDLDGNGTIEAWEFTFATILDGQNTRRVLYQKEHYSYETSETVYDGFTITKGKAEAGAGVYINKKGKLLNCIVKENEVYVTTDQTGTYGGGGIYNSYGTVSHCLIVNNKSHSGSFSILNGSHGGGIYNYQGTVTDCKIMGNTTSSSLSATGGGVVNEGSILHNCIISGNTAIHEGGYHAYGGGIYSYPSNSEKISNCIISGNTASGSSAYGGGICGENYGENITENCIIENNIALNHNPDGECFGGGVFGGYLNRCIISGNSAGNGGGVNASRAFNSLIANNTAAVGGGVCGGSSINCTVVGNTANVAGGGVGRISTFYGSDLFNSIVWNNTAPTDAQVHGIAKIEYSAIQNGFEGEGNVTLTADNLTDGPMFVNPTEENYRLQIGSPCIDKGNNKFFSEFYIESGYDLDGNPRIWNDIVDMGCYEYGSVGIAEHNPENSSVIIYPNPTSGEITVCGERYAVCSIEVYDIYGRKCYVSNLIPQISNQKINISNLPAGVYFVKISTEVEKVVKKIVKE